jgi:hypothetical protein
MIITLTTRMASEGKGRWIPEGWQLPILVIALAAAALVTWVVRTRNKRR